MTACMECGADCPDHRSGLRFCTREHKQSYHNRQIKRGNKIMPLVYRWRALRSSNPDASNAAFSRMCALLADWIEEDRRNGRACPVMPWLGVDSVVRFKPTTSQSTVERADREMNSTFVIHKRNRGERR